MRIKQAVAPEGETKGGSNEEKLDALGRMMLNLKDIKEFYSWSQKQAKAAFVLATVMCGLGSLLLAIAVILCTMLQLDFQVSVIAAIGGGITELIAGTALVL